MGDRLSDERIAERAYEAYSHVMVTDCQTFLPGWAGLSGAVRRAWLAGINEAIACVECWGEPWAGDPLRPRTRGHFP